MEGSMNTESIHSNIKQNEVCNEIIITSVTSSMNSLDYNTTPIPPQKNTRLELPDDLTNEETAVDSYNTNANRDETDSHIDSLRVPASNIENTPLIGQDTGLFGYAPKWFQNICLTPYGILFFLCWASTMQVKII